jgi:methionine-rich copper-binding protein CopC
MFMSVLILVLIAPTSAFAHTGLKSSSPENKQIVKEEVKEISMVFNTDIENLSSLTVKDDQGTEYKVIDKLIEKTTMSGTLEQPLKDGSYSVDWKIIGRDGHPIKGTLLFSVEIPAVETTNPSPSESSSPITTELSSPALQETISPSPSPSTLTLPETDSDSSENTSLEVTSNASWILVILAALVLIVFVISFIRRKNH